MKKATPVQMRKCLEIVEGLKRAGIRFVPIPVYNDSDNDLMLKVLAKRIAVFKEMVNQSKED